MSLRPPPFPVGAVVRYCGTSRFTKCDTGATFGPGSIGTVSGVHPPRRGTGLELDGVLDEDIDGSSTIDFGVGIRKRISADKADDYERIG